MEKNCIDTDCKEVFEDDDTPEVDAFTSNCVRADEIERRKKELRKQEKRILR